MSDRKPKHPGPARRSRRSRGGEPAHIGPLLAATREEAARATRLGPVDLDLWRGVVGPRIADRTRPGQLRRDVLTVTVASAVWAQELSLLKSEILERLQASGLKLAGIRFVVGKLTGPRMLVAPPSPPPPVAPLPRELRGRLDRIEDPELRAAIAEAAGLSLAQAPSSAAKPTAPGLRSAGPRSVRSGPADPAPRGVSRHTRATRPG